MERRRNRGRDGGPGPCGSQGGEDGTGTHQGRAGGTGAPQGGADGPGAHQGGADGTGAPQGGADGTREHQTGVGPWTRQETMTKSEIWGKTETDNTERAETDDTGRVETDNTGRAFPVSGPWQSRSGITGGLHSRARAGQEIPDGSVAVTWPDGESLTASIAVTGQDRES